MNSLTTKTSIESCTPFLTPCLIDTIFQGASRHCKHRHQNSIKRRLVKKFSVIILFRDHPDISKKKENGVNKNHDNLINSFKMRRWPALLIVSKCDVDQLSSGCSQKGRNHGVHKIAFRDHCRRHSMRGSNPRPHA